MCWITSETIVKCTNAAQSVDSEFSITINNSNASALSITGLSKLVDPFIVGNESAIGVGFRDLYGTVYYGSFNSEQVSEFSFTSQVSTFQSLTEFKTDKFAISFDISVVGGILRNSFSENFMNYPQTPQNLCNDDGDCAAGTCVASYCKWYEDRASSVQTLLGISTRGSAPFFAFLGDSATDFSWGRDVFQNTWSCALDVNGTSYASCSVNDPLNFLPLVAVSFTNLVSVTQLLIPPVLDRTSGFYITQETQSGQLVEGVVKFLGVPYCYNGSASGSCSYASIPLVEIIPSGLQSVTQVSLGAWGACAISGGSLSCWGSFLANPQQVALSSWQAYRSVTGVSVYNSGACVQYISNGQQMGNCWGPLSVVGLLSLSSYPEFYSQTVPAQYMCPLEENLVYENLCYGCTFGQSLDFSNGQAGSFPCLDCTSLSGGLPSARGLEDAQCVPCMLGSTTSQNRASCISCPLNSFRSLQSDGITPMAECEECRPGFQASSNFQSCVQCPPGTARYSTSASCAACPSGSTPSGDQGMCITCPQPQILVGTIPNIVCVPCPLGQNAFQGMCRNCETPLIRSQSMFDCASCPEGTQPSPDFTECVPCPPFTVRKNTSRCYACPSGSYASDDQTQCLPEKRKEREILSLGKTASICTGLLVISACAILSSLKKLTNGQSLLGYVMGFLIMAGALLI